MILSVACIIVSSISLHEVLRVLDVFDDMAAANDFTTKSTQLMVTVRGRDMYRWVLDGSSSPEEIKKDIVAMVVSSDSDERLFDIFWQAM
jgi:hypothetical protein